MTAEVIELFPTGDQADETVRRTIAALIKGRDLQVDNVADAIGMKRATLYRRLAGHGSRQAFSAGEVASLARYFGVSIALIFDGMGGTFVPRGGGGPYGGQGVRHEGLEPPTRWLRGLQSVRYRPQHAAKKAVVSINRSTDSSAA